MHMHSAFDAGACMQSLGRRRNMHAWARGQNKHEQQQAYPNASMQHVGKGSDMYCPAGGPVAGMTSQEKQLGSK